jgi:hypothetical protein
MHTGNVCINTGIVYQYQDFSDRRWANMGIRHRKRINVRFCAYTFINRYVIISSDLHS